MITTKCPLRISLVGGSTDTDEFLQKYGKGSVISFTPDIYTFITIHTNNSKKYLINYSKKEVCETIQEIKNDIVRECFEYFKPDFCTITFNSNILATGSGLASSSSYTISVIKAVSMFKNILMTDIEICNLAFKIEKKFNPLAGMQDIYGCGVGDFKRIYFEKNKPPSFKFLDISFITNFYNMYLLNTGVVRNSTNILKTLDVDKSYPLLSLTDEFENIIMSRNSDKFFNIFNDGWRIKKSTSLEIMNSSIIKELDDFFSKQDEVGGYKLCGAGGGGYFLIFVRKDKSTIFEKKIEYNFPHNQIINISIDSSGIRGYQL